MLSALASAFPRSVPPARLPATPPVRAPPRSMAIRPSSAPPSSPLLGQLRSVRRLLGGGTQPVIRPGAQCSLGFTRLDLAAAPPRAPQLGVSWGTHFLVSDAAPAARLVAAFRVSCVGIGFPAWSPMAARSRTAVFWLTPAHAPFLAVLPGPGRLLDALCASNVSRHLVAALAAGPLCSGLRPSPCSPRVPHQLVRWAATADLAPSSPAAPLLPRPRAPLDCCGFPAPRLCLTGAPIARPLGL